MILVVACVFYFAVLPRILSRHYLSRVQTSAGNLSITYNKLAKSATSEPVLNNPDLSTADQQRNLDSIKRLMAEASQQLLVFSNTAEDLHPPPKVGPFPAGYNRALTIKKAATSMVSQSKDVFGETYDLIAYMETYLNLRDNLSAQLNGFNSITDFNSQIGNSSQFKAIANEIRIYAAQLQQTKTPIDMAQFHQQALMTFNQAASSFDDVAAALASGVDSLIYPAVAQVEQVTAQNEGHDEDIFFNSVTNSPTLVDLSNITDKLDQFEALVT